MSMGDSMMAWHRISGRSIPDELGRQLGIKVVDRSVTAARFNYILPITGAMGLNISKQYRAGSWDWVVVNGGGNDLWFGCGCLVCDVTLEKLISGDAENGKIPNLVSKIREDGAKVVFVGYLHSPGSLSIVDHCKDEAEELERRLTLLTKRQNGFFFLDLAEAVPNGDVSFHSVDGIHPSLKASRAIGQLVANIIRTNTP
jgi:acyl-CoA thioesterase I